jgi:hypothetical protein
MPSEEALHRLLELKFQLIPAAEVGTHFIFERDGFVALVERKGDEFGNIGAPGLLCDQGFAALVWRAGEPWFVARGFEQRASTDQVEAIRQFGKDLKAALHA